jgi:hypothetical protein
MEPIMKRCALTLGALVLSASTAAAQAQKGTWEGAVYMQSGSQKLVIVIDSVTSGWTGAAVAAQTTSDSLKLVDVKVKADTMSFGIPYNGMVVYFVGLVADGKFSGGMWVNNANAGSVELTKKSEAAKKP